MENFLSMNIFLENEKMISPFEHKNFVINEISKAKNEFSEIFQTNFPKLRDSSFEKGFFLYLFDNQTDKVKIHLHHSFSDEKIEKAKNLIIVGENCEVSILETFDFASTNFSNSLSCEIFLRKNSKCEYLIFQKNGENISQTLDFQVFQEKESQFNSHFFVANSNVRNQLSINHLAEFCKTFCNGLSVAKNSVLIENQVFMNHNFANGQSQQMFKNIASDKSVAKFLGKVFVAKNSQKTDASQSNKNLLLSETAKIQATPHLEIYTDDVKCSHGSSTGQLDENALFYMLSRGISLKDAKKLLLQAFANDLIEKISIPDFRNYVSENIEHYLIFN